MDLKEFVKDQFKSHGNYWIANYKIHTVTDARGKITEIKMGVVAEEILRNLNRFLDQPLKKVDETLFVVRDERVWYLDNAAQFFSYISAIDVAVDWSKGATCISKTEFFHYCQSVATPYDYLSHVRHIPERSEAYYLPMSVGEANGALDQLVSMFTPATEFDRVMLKAALVTPFWGGRGGERPAFVLDGQDGDLQGGRGIGKSKFTDIVAHLSGGAIDLNLTTNADDMKKRILGGVREGIIRFDNVKAYKASSDVLESLITSPFISGHKMFKGNKARPNYYTYFITFNGANLSKDLAKRSVIIKLRRPEYAAGWSSNLMRFVEDRKADIYADIYAVLGKETTPSPVKTRFAEWEIQVAQKLSTTLEDLSVIGVRQGEADDDDDEASQIKECIEINVSRYLRVGEPTKKMDASRDCLLISYSVLSEWYRQFANLKGMKTKSVMKIIRNSNLPELDFKTHIYNSVRYAFWVPKDRSPGAEKVGAYKISRPYDGLAIGADDFQKFSS